VHPGGRPGAAAAGGPSARAPRGVGRRPARRARAGAAPAPAGAAGGAAGPARPALLQHVHAAGAVLGGDLPPGAQPVHARAAAGLPRLQRARVRGRGRALAGRRPGARRRRGRPRARRLLRLPGRRVAGRRGRLPHLRRPPLPHAAAVRARSWACGPPESGVHAAGTARCVVHDLVPGASASACVHGVPQRWLRRHSCGRFRDLAQLPRYARAGGHARLLRAEAGARAAPGSRSSRAAGARSCTRSAASRPSAARASRCAR
jgi:hypothetical protein